MISTHQSYYVASCMYVGARSFTRASIIVFYLRIFTIKESRRIIIYTLTAEVVLSSTFVLIMLFQCTPVSYYWTKWDQLHPGHCIDSYRYMIAGWSTLIALDFWVMWVPLPMIAKLQLSTRKKLLIGIMFAMGIA